MVIIDIDKVKIGDIVATPVRINKTVIVNPGTVLSPSLVSKLKNLGIKSVWIASLDIEFKKLSRISRSKTKLYNSLARFAKTYSNRIGNLEDIICEYDHGLVRHSLNTSMITNMIISDYTLPLFRRRNIITGAILHDLGKLEVDPLILNKPGKLSKEEFEIIKQHPAFGYESATNLRLADGIKDIILHHHENYDGSGYPDGLSGKEISIGAMAVHIADVYEARCSKRIYKEANARQEIKEDMKSLVGTMFAPDVFEHFRNNVPTYFKGELLAANGDNFLVVGYDYRYHPLFQNTASGEIYTYSELAAVVKDSIIFDSIQIKPD